MGTPPFASAAELALIRAEFATIFLDLSCVISRPTLTETTDGYQEETPATVATVAAKIVPPTTAQLQQYAGRIGTLQAFVVRFPAGTDVRVGDVLTIASQTLKVQAPIGPESWNFLTNVIATEVREGV